MQHPTMIKRITNVKESYTIKRLVCSPKNVDNILITTNSNTVKNHDSNTVVHNGKNNDNKNANMSNGTNLKTKAKKSAANNGNVAGKKKKKNNIVALIVMLLIQIAIVIAAATRILPYLMKNKRFLYTI